MRTGMLWFDNDPKRTDAEKIQLAAAYYQRKYGLRPNLCFVKQVIEDTAVEGITITPSRQVLRNHFWLGVKDA